MEHEDDNRFEDSEDFPGEEGEIHFAPSDQIGEWEEEIERWLPEATGFSVFGALVTDLSALDDFLEMDFDNPREDEQGQTYCGPTQEAWSRAREILLRYGVDINEEDTILIELARKTLGKERARDTPGS